MVHDRSRLEAEATARQLEAEAKQISAETKKYEAETARMTTEQGDSAGSGSGVPRGERKAPMECPSIDKGVTEG